MEKSCSRSGDEESIQTKVLAETITPLVQREAGPEEEIQTKKHSSDLPLSPSLQRRGEFAPSPLQGEVRRGGLNLQKKAEEEEEVQKQPEEEEPLQGKLLQREEEKEEPVQGKFVQREAVPEEEEVRKQPEEQETAQAKGDCGNSPALSPSVESGINSLRGGGWPLPESTRSFFEPRFGSDFSGVRVHTDSNANHLARSINAKAFTVGKDIAFGPGQYSPDSADGKGLIAHELTHTLQQGHAQQKSIKLSEKRSPSIFHGNSTALNIQRVPGVLTNIEKLDEMLDRFNVPEEEVIELLGKLSSDEKKTVLSGRYKKTTADALNINEMVRVVNNLGPPLHVKLDWVEEAAGSVSSIDYDQINGMITDPSVKQKEKDTLKTKPWRDFFVDVCTNKTMPLAVDDLGFELLTKLEWMDAEGSNWALVKAKIIGTADPLEKTDLYGSASMKLFFVSICDDATIAEATSLLGGTWIQKDAWMMAEGVTVPVDMNYSSSSRKYGYSKGDATNLYGLNVAPALVPASGFKEKSRNFYIYNKQWSDGLGMTRLKDLKGDCGEYAKALIDLTRRAPLPYPPIPAYPAYTPLPRPGIGLAPASDLTPGHAYFIVPTTAVGAGAGVEDVLSPWNNREIVEKHLTAYHVATVVAKDGGTVITSEVNAAFAHKRIKPWFAMYSGNAGFFSTYKKEYKKGANKPDLYKI